MYEIPARGRFCKPMPGPGNPLILTGYVHPGRIADAAAQALGQKFGADPIKIAE
jgi:hypothetical protein